MGKKKLEQKETFGTNVGEGIGCLLILLGIGALLSFPAIINLLATIFGKCK